MATDRMATSSTKLTHSLVLLRPSFKNVLYLASLGAAILPVSTTNLSLSQGTELWLPPSSSPRRRVYSQVSLEAVQCGQQSKRPKPLPRAPTSFACWYVFIGALSGLSPTTLHVYFPCAQFIFLAGGHARPIGHQFLTVSTQH